MLLSLVGIFKNESRNIRAVLKSARPFIDRWTIIDTGSTDGTQAIIKEVMGDLCGQLIEEPFAGYMATRNRVLELDAKAETPARFQLMLSGDECLVNGAELRNYLETTGDKADCHCLDVHVDGEVVVPRPVITRTGSNFRYEDFDCGVHEIVHNAVDQRAPVGFCRAAAVRHDTTDPDRKLDSVRDFHVPQLIAALERNPENARALEYLAQSYEYLANHEPDEDDRDRYSREAVRWYGLRLDRPFSCPEEKQVIAARFVDAARVSGQFKPQKLLDMANRLCDEDKVHAEPALLRTIIATTVDGLTVGQIYKFATDAIKRAETARTGLLTDSAPRATACEWQAHRFAAIAAMNLSKAHPEMVGVSRDHIVAGLSLGGPWAAFQSIANELQPTT